MDMYNNLDKAEKVLKLRYMPEVFQVMNQLKHWLRLQGIFNGRNITDDTLEVLINGHKFRIRFNYCGQEASSYYFTMEGGIIFKNYIYFKFGGKMLFRNINRVKHEGDELLPLGDFEKDTKILLFPHGSLDIDMDDVVFLYNYQNKRNSSADN